MNLLRTLLALPFLLSAACAVAPGSSDETTAGSSEAEVTAATATITFDGSFEQRVSEGALQPGRTVKVVYDADRLTACRGEQGGIPQWSITGYYKIDDGPVKTFAAGGLALQNGPSSFLLDRPGDLQIWFGNSSRWGCIAYDSAYGENYHFTVAFPEASSPTE